MALTLRSTGITTPFSGNVNSRSFAVDASAQAGDWMVIVCFTNDGTKTLSSTQATLVADVANSTLSRIVVFKKKLASGDLGGSVTINISASGFFVGFSALIGGSDATDALFDAPNVAFYPATTARTLNTRAVTRAGSIELMAMFDKVTSTELTSSYTVPSGFTKLQEAYAAGSGAVSGVLAKRNATLNSGDSAGGWVVTADHAPSNIAAAVIVIAPAVNAQYARPASDVTKTSVSANPAVSVFAGNVDEATLDSADYVQFDAVGAVYETKLSALVDPLSSSGHEITSVLGPNPGSTSTSWQVDIVQGTTVKATFTHNGVTTQTTFVDTLTGTQADSITDYSDLRYRLTLTAAS